MGSDHALMAFADDRIAFPVSDPGFIGDNSGAFINADAVGNVSSAVMFSVTFTPFFLATQILMKILSLMSVSVDMQVNVFVADLFLK